MNKILKIIYSLTIFGMFIIFLVYEKENDLEKEIKYSTWINNSIIDKNYKKNISNLKKHNINRIYLELDSKKNMVNTKNLLLMLHTTKYE